MSGPEQNELESFRKQWLSELQYKNKDDDQKKRKTGHVSTQEQRLGIDEKVSVIQENIMENPGHTLDREDENQPVNTNKNKTDGYELKKNRQQEYEAFTIANKYLNITGQSSCRYCKEDNQRHLHSTGDCRRGEPNIDSTYSRKRKRTNSDEKYKNETTKRRESLVDQLILDIDEITSIPFFDLELPKEIAVKVFTYLSIHDLYRCCLVNKQWKAIAEDDLIWFAVYERLNLNKDGLDVGERDSWKMFVRDEVLQKRFVQQKWKERFCEVRDLENEKGGILCAADIHDECIVIAYLDGSIRIWDLLDGSYGHNLKEQYTNDEDIITSVCTHVALSKKLSVATFLNGDIMIWNRDSKLSGHLTFMTNNRSIEIRDINVSGNSDFMCVHSYSKVLLFTQNENETWNWNLCYEYECTESKIFEVGLTDNLLIVNIRDKLLSIRLHDRAQVIIDSIAGATFSCIDYTRQHLITAVNGFGYNFLGGFRIRKYCLTTCKEICNITGPQCTVQCLNYRDYLDDQVIVGCSDRAIRIYELSTSTLLSCIPRINSDINTLQMDEWKVLSGHQDGSISLWDRHNGAMYWETRMKHPVMIGSFTNRLLTIVNVPEEKLPRNSNWYADDLIQPRKYRGSIRVMDFTKDTVHGSLPKEFHADYDNITGYDYNIELIAPYDNVEALNLPKI